MKKFYTLLSLLITFALSTNLTAQTCSDGNYQWSDIATIFENNGCSTADCHGGGISGLDLTTYDGFNAGGLSCENEISDGTTLVDIIQTDGVSCSIDVIEMSMNSRLAAPVPQADIDALQAWIDAGSFELCRGEPLDDGVCTPATTVGDLSAPGQTTLCNDGSDAVTFATPTGSLPDVQIVVEVNGTLITISDDGSFDTSILSEGDEVCYTAFTFDLAAINALLTTASGLCPILDCDVTFDLVGVNQAISDLVNGYNDGVPGLNDLQEALDFAGSFGNPIGSVQTAGSTLDALNVTIGGLLGNVCYASSEAVCLGVVACGGPCTGDEVEVIFSVDMSCSGTTARPPVVTGPFNDFSGDGNIMIDPDGDDIWEAVICALPGISFEYKYAIQDFVEQENLVDDAIGGAACDLNTNFFDYSNRLVTIPAGGGALPTDAYGICGTCENPPINVTFNIDMNCSDITSGTPVAMFGGFNGFCCAYGLQDADGDNIWTTTLPFPTDDSGCISMQYLYMSPDLDNIESFLDNGEDIANCPNITSDYYSFANRIIEVCEDVVLDEYWNSCSALTEPAEGCDDGDCANGTETWDGCACVSGDPTGVLGCTDAAFCEYNPDADCDDGSCATSNADPGTCNTDCTVSDTQVWDATSCSCVVDVVSVLGCNDMAATNFDANANCNDGTCTYEMCEDPCAPNFEAQEACEEYDMTCNTDCTMGDIQEWDATTCACTVVTATILGCTDETANNYNAAANCDDESCTYDMCEDPCAPNFEAVGACDPYEMDCNTDCNLGDIEEWDSTTCACAIVTTTVLGCTDETANNYNAAANCDDESCTYDMCEDPCAPNFEAQETCEPYEMDCNTDCTMGDIQEWDATACACAVVTATVLGCTDETATNYDMNANCDDESCIYEMCTDPCAPNFEAQEACEPYEMDCNTDCTIGDVEEWDATLCACAIVTTSISGCTDETATNYNAAANCDDESCMYDMCEDPCAPNFGATGACESYDMTCPEDDCFTTNNWDPETCSCDATAIDIVCIDEDECTTATIDETTCECVYETIPDCGEVEGCTDACAPNYNAEATIDDGSCEEYDRCPEDECLATYTWDPETCSCSVGDYAEPDCDDMNECTTDSFDLIICECVNEPIPDCGVPTCPTPGVIEDCE